MVSSGIKVLVLAVIVGIGSGLFAEFRTPPDADPSIDHALVIILASLAMLGLGIFGPGIATGLVSGAPQLGAGAAAGTALGAAGLVVAGGAAATNLPWYAVLTLPVLFAAGMSLLDTIDGAFMNLAYGWAFTRPVRKIFYNLTVTALSVAVALVVGVIELTSILTDKLGLATGPIAWVGRIDLGEVGFWIVGLFLLTWLGALAVWRFRRIEERWGSALSE